MEYWKNGKKYIVPDLTEEELAEIERQEQEQEKQYWLEVDYGVAINSEIRKKYSESEEFAILRQKEEKPEEYQEYYNYCEECKAYVKSKKEEVGVINE